MADYQRMYHLLFNEMTRAIEIMQNAQRSAENLYIDADETALTLLDPLEVQPDPPSETEHKQGK